MFLSYNYLYVMAYSDSLNNSLQAQGTSCVILFLKHSPLTRDILVWSTEQIKDSDLQKRMMGAPKKNCFCGRSVGILICLALIVQGIFSLYKSGGIYRNYWGGLVFAPIGILVGILFIYLIISMEYTEKAYG